MAPGVVGARVPLAQRGGPRNRPSASRFAGPRRAAARPGRGRDAGRSPGRRARTARRCARRRRPRRRRATASASANRSAGHGRGARSTGATSGTSVDELARPGREPAVEHRGRLAERRAAATTAGPRSTRRRRRRRRPGARRRCPRGPSAAAKRSGDGSGCRPSAGVAGADRSVSTSSQTAPGRCPARYASRPERPSRYQRTSTTRTSARCAASHSPETSGPNAHPPNRRCRVP